MSKKSKSKEETAINNENGNLILKDISDKFNRQSEDNRAFDIKMGLILGFLSVYFIGLLLLLVENSQYLTHILFLLGFGSAFISIIVFLFAFHPIEFADPPNINSFYSSDNLKLKTKNLIKKFIECYKNAYIKNKSNMQSKSKLFKAGLRLFLLSLVLIFTFIIHSNMTTFQTSMYGDEDETPSYDVVIKDDDGEDFYDIKELGE